MTIRDIAMLISLIILAVVMAIYYTQCKHKLRSIVISLISGAAALACSCTILPLFGIAFSANLFTISAAICGGAPAILLITLAAIF